jgi:hypothetical protein
MGIYIYIFVLHVWIGPIASIYSPCEYCISAGVLRTTEEGWSRDYFLGCHWCIRFATSFVSVYKCSGGSFIRQYSSLSYLGMKAAGAKS